MKPRRKHLCLAILMVMASSAIAETLEIKSWKSGQITWEDSFENGYYQVQWSSSLTSGWHSSWSKLSSIVANGSGTQSHSVPMFYRLVFLPAVVNEMILVPAGGQPQGPFYDFRMSEYPITTDEFACFLNNAQANTNNARGEYMYFMEDGNVYMKPESEISYRVFIIIRSRLTYNPSAEIGYRYGVYPDYHGHPITGASWYGALKYCNWLTLDSGLPESARCYSEGNDPTDWKPVHVSWEDFVSNGFSDSARLEWLSYDGFRLPMDHCSSGANYYNEYYKAAAWNGTDNKLFGFGRDTIDGSDSNYSNSGDPFESFTLQSTPVDYYNGNSYGAFNTRSNENHYGIFDLSGNVEEWMTDATSPINTLTRSTRGSHWGGSSKSLKVAEKSGCSPYITSTQIGFRVVTTNSD